MFRERIAGGEAVKGVCVDTRRMQGGKTLLRGRCEGGDGVK